MPTAPRWQAVAIIAATHITVIAATAIIWHLNGWEIHRRGPDLANELRKGSVQSAQLIAGPPDAAARCLEQADSIALPLISAPASGSVARSLVNEARHIAILMVAKDNGTLALLSAPQPPSASERTVLDRCLVGPAIEPPPLRID